MRRKPPRSRRATWAALAWVLTAGCTHDTPKPAPPSSTREALATLRSDLAEQLVELPSVPPDSAAERARLGELATRGRALLRRVRERPAALAPEQLAAFLAPLDANGARGVRHQRATFQGRTYAIASLQLASGDAAIWLDVIDPAGSPELLAAFEVERAVASRSGSDGRFEALELGSQPAVRSSGPRAGDRPGQVARTLQLLVADRLLVSARATAAVDPARLAEWVARIDLAGLARLAESASTTTSAAPPAGPVERSDDG